MHCNPFDQFSIHNIYFYRNEEILQEIRRLRQMNISFRRKGIASNIRKMSSDSHPEKEKECGKKLSEIDFNRIEVPTVSSSESSGQMTSSNNNQHHYQHISLANGKC